MKRKVPTMKEVFGSWQDPGDPPERKGPPFDPNKVWEQDIVDEKDRDFTVMYKMDRDGHAEVEEAKQDLDDPRDLSAIEFEKMFSPQEFQKILRHLEDLAHDEMVGGSDDDSHGRWDRDDGE